MTMSVDTTTAPSSSTMMDNTTTPFTNDAVPVTIITSPPSVLTTTTMNNNNNNNISSFPLFNNLLNETNAMSEYPNLSYDEQIDLCQQIKEIDDEGCEIIFALIKFYYIIIDHGFIENLPYKPKVNKSGYKYELNSLPIQLIHIIQRFVQLHRSKIEVDKYRQITH